MTDSSQGQQNGSGPYNSIPPRQLPPLGYQQAPVQPGIHHYAQNQTGLDPLQQYPPAIYTNYTHSSSYPHNQQQNIYQPRQTNPHTGAEETDADAEPDPDVPAAYTHN